MSDCQEWMVDCPDRNTITESCLLRSRRLWALFPMTLSHTSRPVSPTCWCTPTWPCGPVHLRGHSCLTTPLQSTLPERSPSTRNRGHKDKMSHALSKRQHIHNPQNLCIHRNQCRYVTWHLLNQWPQSHRMSLFLHICQLRPCSQRCPHRLTCTVRQRTPRFSQNRLQFLLGKRHPLKCTHCQIILHRTMNQCELESAGPSSAGAREHCLKEWTQSEAHLLSVELVRTRPAVPGINGHAEQLPSSGLSAFCSTWFTCSPVEPSTRGLCPEGVEYPRGYWWVFSLRWAEQRDFFLFYKGMSKKISGLYCGKHLYIVEHVGSFIVQCCISEWACTLHRYCMYIFV